MDYRKIIERNQTGTGFEKLEKDLAAAPFGLDFVWPETFWMAWTFQTPCRYGRTNPEVLILCVTDPNRIKHKTVQGNESFAIRTDCQSAARIARQFNADGFILCGAGGKELARRYCR